MKVKTNLRAGSNKECRVADPVTGKTVCCEDVPETCFIPPA